MGKNEFINLGSLMCTVPANKHTDPGTDPSKETEFVSETGE